MRGKVVLLTGAPAVGKSTLARLLVEHMEPLQRISFGQLLFDRKKMVYPDLTYEELRTKSAEIVTHEDVAALDTMLVDEVNESRSVTNVVIDSHAVTKEAFGFRVTSFSLVLLTKLNLDAVMVLNCEPEELARRIEQDSEGRAPVSVEELCHHMYLQESLAMTYGVLCGCPTFILNGNRLPGDTAKVVAELLRGLNVLTPRTWTQS